MTLSEEDATLKATLEVLAGKMIKDGKNLPTKIKKKLFEMEKLAFNGDFSINVVSLLISECMKILFQEFDIEATSCRRVYNDKIRNAKIYEYEYRTKDGNFFYLICMTKVGNNFLSSLQALTDALIGYRAKTGCDSCNYSEEGCLNCGLNKVRKILTEDPTVKTFKQYGSLLFDTVGTKIDPVIDLIDWYIDRNTDNEGFDNEIGRLNLDIL
jgi:hypothetical protein